MAEMNTDVTGQDDANTDLRIILEFSSPPDLDAVRSGLAARLGREATVQPLMESHGLESGTADPMSRFIAATVPGVPRSIPDSEAFEIASEMAAASGALTAEPELGTDFYLVPDRDAALESASDLLGCWVEPDRDPTDAKPRWAIEQINAPAAWAMPPRPGGRARGEGIRIFQPDTGVADHVELEAGMIDSAHAWDFVRNRPGAVDTLDYRGNPGHGTGTASVVASREAGDVIGSAPSATLTPLRAIKSVVVLFDHGRVAAAIEHARRSGADVITMSLGGAWSSAVRAAIGEAIRDGVIVLAAAGNCVRSVVWPARYEEVIAVAGSNIERAPWQGSCRGSDVDITAPGEFVPRANRHEDNHGSPTDVRGGQGTSFAVALTAGVAALWLAHNARGRSYGNASPTLQAEFDRALKLTAAPSDKLDPRDFGPGIVDSAALLALQPTGAQDEVALEAPSVPPLDDGLLSLRTLLAESGALESAMPENALSGVAALDDETLHRHAAEISHQALKARARGARPRQATGLESPLSGEPPRFSEALGQAMERAGATEQAGLEAIAAPDTQTDTARADREGQIWLRDYLGDETGMESLVDWITSLRRRRRGSGETGGGAGTAQGSGQISSKAFNMIVGFEVTSQERYESRYRMPIWPGVNSGVTIGIGYDVGYVSRERLREDWRGAIPDAMISALETAVGITGSDAKPVADSLKDKVDVPWGPALSVHRGKVLPRWTAIVRDALDNTGLLSGDCLGALVSLTYNRGASFRKDGDRYREMRAIRQHMAERRFDRIASEIRDMKRIWPDVPGLQSRREAEARLFEAGLEAREPAAARDPEDGPVLRVISDKLNLRSEPSSSKGGATVIAELSKGDLVRQTEWSTAHADWIRADCDGKTGYLKRMLLTQHDLPPLAAAEAELLEAYNDAVWDATERYDAVRYKLGGKDPRQGSVDCSGWIAFANRLGFNAVNARAGRTVFTEPMLRLLNTHSDHQVSLVGFQTNRIYSGESIDAIDWRPGLMIGINFGDYDWERGQNRVFEIDHIVQTMRSRSGTMFVTQSSSGGGGVNRVKLSGWLESKRALQAAWRLHVVDLFALPALVAAGLEGLGAPEPQGEALELPELDVTQTPSG